MKKRWFGYSLFACFSLLLGACDQTTTSSSIDDIYDIEKVNEVEALISDLPSPSTNNQVVISIFTVQDAYNDLNEKEKGMVENYTVLESYVDQIYSLVTIDGTYSSKYEVALYIFLYDDLPSNFITKDEAEALGWTGGSLWFYADGKSIGGDRFYNRERLLPEGVYYECDIDYQGERSRNALRIVYSLSLDTIYYTSNHYSSFEQLY